MLHFKPFLLLMAPPPMPCSSTSAEGWGGVELPLAGLTLALSMRSTVSVDPTLLALDVDTHLPTVPLYTSSVVVNIMVSKVYSTSRLVGIEKKI